MAFFVFPSVCFLLFGFRLFVYKEARKLLDQIPRKRIKWVSEEEMTVDDRKESTAWKTTRGCLKELDKSEGCQAWLDNLEENKKDVIRAIPNFDAEIFYECTGIKVE